MRQFIDPAINDIQDQDECDKRLQEAMLLLASWMQMQRTEYGLTKTTYPSDHPKNLPSSSGGQGCTFTQPHSCHTDEDEEEPVVGKKWKKIAANAVWRLKHLSFLSDSFKWKDDTTKLGGVSLLYKLLIMKLGETLHVLAHVNDFGY